MIFECNEEHFLGLLLASFWFLCLLVDHPTTKYHHVKVVLRRKAFRIHTIVEEENE